MMRKKIRSRITIKIRKKNETLVNFALLTIARRSGILISHMKSLTDYLSFELPNRRGFVNITNTVEALVRKSGIKEGLCLVNAMHIRPCVAYLSFLQNPVSSKALAIFRRCRW